MPVGWVNVAGPASPTGAAGAHDSLRAVLTYTGTDIVPDACVSIPVRRGAVGTGGLISDPTVRAGAGAALAALAARVAATRAA